MIHFGKSVTVFDLFCFFIVLFYCMRRNQSFNLASRMSGVEDT